MKLKWKRFLLPVLFAFGGALIGLAYYYLVGCNGGSCLVTASPIRSMVYVATVGVLLAQGFAEGPDPMEKNGGKA